MSLWFSKFFTQLICFVNHSSEFHISFSLGFFLTVNVYATVSHNGMFLYWGKLLSGFHTFFKAAKDCRTFSSSVLAAKVSC